MLGARIESMFEGLSDVAVVAGIEETTRAEAIAAARRSALVAELASRRRVDADDEERQRWVVDPWAATTAEISAAMGISTRAASKEMCIALALRDRLPKVAALYAQGVVSARVVATITWRAAGAHARQQRWPAGLLASSSAMMWMAMASARASGALAGHSGSPHRQAIRSP